MQEKAEDKSKDTHLVLSLNTLSIATGLNAYLEVHQQLVASRK